MPLATTMPAPTIKLTDGVADQNIQSIAKAQRMEVYSKGATTEGGARRKASVNQYCPSAPKIPMPASQIQSPLSTGCQSRIARRPEPKLIRPKYQNTMDMLEFEVPSVRTVSALNA